WFPGVHSDVGGGYGTKKDDDPLPSDFALEWMIDCAKRAGLEFDAGVMATYKTHRSPTAALHESMTPFYRLQRPLVRPIGVADAPQQSYDGAVVDRPGADHPRHRLRADAVLEAGHDDVGRLR